MRRRAAAHGISVGAEVRQTLRSAMTDDDTPVGMGHGTRIAARFARSGLNALG